MAVALPPLLQKVLSGEISPDEARKKDPTFDLQWARVKEASKRRADIESPPATRATPNQPPALPREALKRLRPESAPKPLPPESQKWGDFFRRQASDLERELAETRKKDFWSVDLCAQLVFPPVPDEDDEELDKQAKKNWEPLAKTFKKSVHGLVAAYQKQHTALGEREKNELEPRLLALWDSAEHLEPALLAHCTQVALDWERQTGRKLNLPLPREPFRTATPPPGQRPFRTVTPPPAPPPVRLPAKAAPRVTRPAPRATPKQARPALPPGWPPYRPRVACACPNKRPAVNAGVQSGWRCRTKRGWFTSTPRKCNFKRT